MKEVGTKVVVKGLNQCVSDSQVLKDNLPLHGIYTQKYGGYTKADFGFVVYDAVANEVGYSGTWRGEAQLFLDEDPDIYRLRITEPITKKQVLEFVQCCKDSRK